MSDHQVPEPDCERRMKAAASAMNAAMAVGIALSIIATIALFATKL